MTNILLLLPWFRTWLQKPSRVDRAWFDGFETGIAYAKAEQQLMQQVDGIVSQSPKPSTRESRRVH